MAKNDLDINLKTKYSGEGINKLNNALVNTSKRCKTVSGSVSLMSSAISQLSGSGSSEIAKLTRSVSGLANGFATGGVIGVAITGITVLWDKWKKSIEETKQKVTELGEKIKDSLVKGIEAAKDKFNGLIEKFSSTSKIISTKYEAADIRKIQKREVEGFNERQGMTLKHEKDYSTARLKIDIEEIENNAKKRNSDTTVKEAEHKVKQLTEALRQINDEYDKQMSLFQKKLSGIDDVVGGNEEKKAEIEKLRNELTKAYNEQVKAQEKAIVKATYALREARAAQEKSNAEYARKELEIQMSRIEAEQKHAEDVKKYEEELRKAEQKKLEERIKLHEDAEKAMTDAAKTALNERIKELNKEAESIRNTASGESSLQQLKSKQWEERASLARGKTFKEYNESLKQDSKDALMFAKERNKNKDEEERLRKRITDRNGRIKRTASDQDVQRYNRLRDWNMYNGENPFEKNLNEIQQEANRKLERIAQATEKLTEEAQSL